MSEFKITTPIAFIVFNRLDCTMEVFEQIREAKPTKLYVISDGPRDNKPGEEEKVNEVRAYIQAHIDWECDVKYNMAEKNMGCKYRIYSGINWVFENEESAIILEDDCVPRKDFFRYTQELLELYKDDESVWLISGINVLRKENSKEQYFFTYLPSIWGWATWKRAWMQIDIEMDTWPETMKNGSIKYVYDFWSYRCYLRIADHQVRLKRDSWAIPWQYSMNLHHGKAIVPRENMIRNVGCGHPDASNVSGAVNDDFTYGKALDFPLEKTKINEVDKLYNRTFCKETLGFKKEWNYIKYLFTRIIPKIKEKVGF